MKKITDILYVMLFFYCGIATSQQLVQTSSDVYKLEESKAQFLNKPLKNMLKEIKPEIKAVIVFNEEVYSILIFRFTTSEQQRNREGFLVDRVTLVVYVKESVIWNWEDRSKGSETVWTTADAQKYANLTVLDIGVVPYED